MSRCIACNRLLAEEDLFLIKKDGSQEDLCFYCRHIVEQDLKDEDIFDFVPYDDEHDYE